MDWRRGTVNASQTRNMQIAQNVSQVFLGINMKCASCHDSFIDRWTLQEAYDLAAVFAEETLSWSAVIFLPEKCHLLDVSRTWPIDPKASKKIV